MKAKELKAYLSLIDDEEDIFIKVGVLSANLSSIELYKDNIYLCSHNYQCNDDEITLANMAKYLGKKK